MIDLKEFKKQKDFLICVDSDGCAMDTMDIKHFKCFGPCMVKEWKLEQWQDEILTRWNEINLYTLTRGINRFAGLSMALSEINEKYSKIEGVEEFAKWVKVAKELSNDSVKQMMLQSDNGIFNKALLWSLAVNREINALAEHEKKPFEGVKEGLAALHKKADIAVVSSANKDAVIEEWSLWNLIKDVDVLCCQDAGTKKECIAMFKKQNYEPGHILMVGDAVGDRQAAESNEVYYYPILVKHETDSWKELVDMALDKFIGLDYADYEAQKKKEFEENLM
ncbi:MAG: HAD hydrolase-like protein [Lachnospira sp.]|nr:HAD hydrolase-like protein [Lachnospira sp.]